MPINKTTEHFDRLIASIEKNTKATEVLEYRIFIVSIIGTLATVMGTLILVADIVWKLSFH